MKKNRAADLGDEGVDYVICRHCGHPFLHVNVTHLRLRHRYRGAHPVEDYKTRFGLEISMCDESRERRKQANIRRWAVIGRHWTPARLLRAIREAHKAGQDLRVGKISRSLRYAGYHLFGSWKKAVAAAGVDYDSFLTLQRWSPEKVLQMIRDLAGRRQPINNTDIRRHFPDLFDAGRKRFGNWGNVLRAAGFDPAEHKKPVGKWNRSTAEKWVRERVARKKPVRWQDAPIDLDDFVRRRLGMNWRTFIESLGLRYRGRAAGRTWSRAKVRDAIRQRKAAGKLLHARGVCLDDPSLYQQARKHYGSWFAAMQAALGVKAARATPLRGRGSHVLQKHGPAGDEPGGGPRIATAE
jgi:hypothetical protein